MVTGLLYISPDSKDMVEQNELVDAPIYNLPFEQLCPGTLSSFAAGPAGFPAGLIQSRRAAQPTSR